MPFRIQRVPRGLNDLLAIFGGQSPSELEDRVRSTLDLLQCYGNTQIQFLSNNNAALAENGVFSIALPATNWSVLFGVSSIIVKTATMTACQASYVLGPSVALGVALGSTGSMTPFGATETGAVAHAILMPYPRLIPPGYTVNFRLDILGTDATANCSCTCQFGVLG